MPVAARQGPVVDAVDVSNTATPGALPGLTAAALRLAGARRRPAPGGRARTHMLDRCEKCGLVLAREDAGEGLAAMIERIAEDVGNRRQATIEAPNAASWQAYDRRRQLGRRSGPRLSPRCSPRARSSCSLEHEGLELDERLLRRPPRDGLDDGRRSSTCSASTATSLARAGRGELRPGNSRGGWAGFVDRHRGDGLHRDPRGDPDRVPGGSRAARPAWRRAQGDRSALCSLSRSPGLSSRISSASPPGAPRCGGPLRRPARGAPTR